MIEVGRHGLILVGVVEREDRCREGDGLFECRDAFFREGAHHHIGAVRHGPLVELRRGGQNVSARERQQQCDVRGPLGGAGGRGRGRRGGRGRGGGGGGGGGGPF